MIEGTPDERRHGWRITRVAASAITRGRYMVWRSPCGVHAIVTGGTGQPVIDTAHVQRRMVEACGKAAAGLMAMLALIRRRRVRSALANGLSRIAVGMATYALLGPDGRILVVDRVGLHEIARRGVTRIAIPTVRIHGVVHGTRGAAPGVIDRISVGTIVTRAATGCVDGVYRIHKRNCRGKTTRPGTVDARAVGRIRVTHAAIRRRGNVTGWFRDHAGCVMCPAIVATAAVAGDTCRGMVKGCDCETTVDGTMADQTIRPTCSCHWHMRC